MLNKTSPVLREYSHNEVSALSAPELVDKIFGRGGVYDRLAERWDAYEKHQQWRGKFLETTNPGAEPTFKDKATGTEISGARALDPSPEVDGALSELVGLCIGTYKEGVVKEFFELANANPEYKKRLASLPAISANSEGEMEKYYARKALERIEKRDNGSVAMEESAVQDIKEKAEKRVREYLEKAGIRFTRKHDAKDKMNLFVPADSKDTKLAKDIKKARKLFRLDETIQPFPYTHNYEHLAYGEKFLMESPAGHGNYPRSLQDMAKKVALPANDPEGTSAESKRIKAKNPQLFGIEELPEKYMTFVGSGALPLTGFVNQIITGCKVNLIDVDPEAVELSQKLRTHLEFLGVLDKDAVSVYIEHGNQVHYGGPRENQDRLVHRGKRFVLPDSVQHYRYDATGEVSSRKNEDIKYIPTDILYLASLIPNHIKKSIVRNLEQNKLDPVPVAIVRSARGLSSMLYEPIHEGDKDIIGSSSYYHDYGSIVPKRHTVTYTNPHTARDEGYISPSSITALVSDDNVNTAHIYHRSSVPMANCQIVYLPGSAMDKKLRAELDREGGQMDYSHLTEHGPAVLAQMRKELERHARKNGVEVDTSFLDKKNLDRAQTAQALVQAYQDMGRLYDEKHKEITR